MGFIEDLANAIISGAEETVFRLIWILIIRPMSQFVAGLIGFLQDVIIGTPYPRVSETSPVPAVLNRPGNQPWAFLFDLHEAIFQPYAYLLLFIILIAALFLDTLGGLASIDSSGASETKKKFFRGFLLVTFWWYLGTLILATSDALTQLLVSAVSQGQDPDSVGLVAIWEAVAEEITGESINSVGGAEADSNSAPVSTVLMIPLILIWIIEAIILLIIAILWVLRMFVIFVLMPVMPIFIAFYVMHLPGFDRIQSLGEDALKWFVSLAFITLPAAIVVAVSGRIIEDVLSFGTDVLIGGGSMSEPNTVEALNSYDTQTVIAHPQVGETVYGDGVTGLGATGQGQIEIIAALGGILFAVILLIAIPILAGLAPFLLYRSESVELGQGAINPAAGVMTQAGKARERVKNTRESVRDVRQGNVGDLQGGVEGKNFRDAITGENLKTNLQNHQGSLFGLAASKGANETQKRASQMRSGAESASARTMSGLSKADELQMMARANPGEMSEVMRTNLREGVKKTIDPEKQRARAVALGQKPQDAADAVGGMVDRVEDQRNSINNRLEERSIRQERYESMSPAEVRQRYETKQYTPDEETIDTLAQNDPTLVMNDTKSEMLSEMRGLKEIGAQSPAKAQSALQAMSQSVRDGLAGTNYNAKKHVNFLNQLGNRVENGEITPQEAMQLADEVVMQDLNEQVNTDKDVKDEKAKVEDMYEKFGANFDSTEDFRMQSLSESEINALPELASVLGGYGVRKNRLKKALKEDGIDLDTVDLDEMQENPEMLLDRVSKETFNEMNVSEHFKAKYDIDEDGARAMTNFTESELRRRSADELRESIQNERDSDLDIDEAKRFYNKDRVEVSNKDSKAFVNDILRGDDSVRKEKVEEALGKSMDDMDKTELTHELAMMAKDMAKAKGEAHGKDLQMVDEMEKSAFVRTLEAKEEFREQAVQEMINNAPSKEAALNLLSSQRGALVEAAGADPTDSHSQADQEEILETLLEQELSGEEMQTAISERFHEEFEDTGEMLENIDEIQQTRNLVKEVSENIDMDEVKEAYESGVEEAVDETREAVSVAEKIENLDTDANMTVEEFKEEFGVDIADEIDLTSVEGRSDTATLEQLGVDSKDIVETQLEEAKTERFESAKSTIEDKFGFSPAEVGMDEVTTENIKEFAEKAAKKNAANKMSEELKAEAKTE